ncbi:DUF1810 domain-containing protein [Parvularcula maris]|uniref:DUF1810 domain-containing protein n=1 Tax=Parvularcula maris TaxID=2965077 RepID=A0A9X2RID8_9PROT|nr:DUF1810 domain-containing protein [Parvularcula maris]MCQ8185940.1 DUF1810 domain-containing protein [Parvularcula maris]
MAADAPSVVDKHDLERFVRAQNDAGTYGRALEELRAGRKETHWMWFVFPQIEGLGKSEIAQRYAVRGTEEAERYLAHDVLGPRLREATGAVMQHRDKALKDIFWEPDDLKFRSSVTLFEAAGGGALFGEALEAFCGGERDEKTLRRVSK